MIIEKEKKKQDKKRKRATTQHDWKHQKKKTAKNNQQPMYKSWEDVVKDLQRREQLEKEFLRKKSDEQLERKVQGLVWKAMKVCRSLDERAGCPASFVNGLWAPLYEQEARRSASLTEGWEIRHQYGRDQGVIIYRNIQTGEEYENHPDPRIESMLEKARKAELTNKFRFQDEPRLFLGEIVEYLREDHEYLGMDEDIDELEEEERARDNPSTRKESEYDY
eukprot:CAMPEP_0178931184 /NCGR_PEP_ID=MMETSP0786-20121207/21754_1 /TAXON_ID=186022 /ORGANISM="Thalassionema frauenfeldii, Strain CCMP 1798" /LENGTH=220 /DNA_ID=CAMNT_0020608003 /DNA_START=145 /DNA_END=807 /DNA_ORIENTATION=-